MTKEHLMFTKYLRIPLHITTDPAVCLVLHDQVWAVSFGMWYVNSWGSNKRSTCFSYSLLPCPPNTQNTF